jgi:hypothetical protein
VRLTIRVEKLRDRSAALSDLTGTERRNLFAAVRRVEAAAAGVSPCGRLAR